MGARVVQAEVSRIEAIGRQRALDPGETIQLDKMIRMERRYVRKAEKRTPDHRPPSGMSADVPVHAAAKFAIGGRVRFTCPTVAGPRTYEATVCGYRTRGRESVAGWIETIDEAGYRRSVPPSRCQVVDQ